MTNEDVSTGTLYKPVKAVLLWPTEKRFAKRVLLKVKTTKYHGVIKYDENWVLNNSEYGLNSGMM